MICVIQAETLDSLQDDPGHSTMAAAGVLVAVIPGPGRLIRDRKRDPDCPRRFPIFLEGCSLRCANYGT